MIEIFSSMPKGKNELSSLDKKLKKQKLKKLKNESRNRRGGRGKQKIHASPVPIHEKVIKTEREI